MVQAIMDHLDLYVEKQFVPQIDLKEMLILFITSISIQKNQIGRFVGFKTSHGTQEFPNDFYGPQWFFIRPKLALFSTDKGTGPVMVTGIYYSEDLYEHLAKFPLLNRLVDIEV